MELFHEDSEKPAAENKIITSDADITTTVNSEMTTTAAKVEEAYKNFMDATQSSTETHIVTIGSDVRKSLVNAAPYLPLVNKLATYVVPDLSPRDVVTLSLNVAALTTQGAADYENADITGDQTKPNIGATISQYATGIYGKLKESLITHLGHVKNYFSNEEKTNSLVETHSIFDHVKSKMNIFGSFMNSIDSPQTENKENQIETIVTQTYIEGSKPPITNTVVTKKYENGVESVRQATNGETNILSPKLLENANHKVGKIITDMKNEFKSNESMENDSDVEAYDDDGDDGNTDDDDENTNDEDENTNEDDGNMNDVDGKNTIEDEVQIKEEDFNRVMQESMALQPDFINTLDGEELLKRIDALQKSLSNPNPNNRKTLKAVTEELDLDEHYSDDHVNELIDVLEITTNYFIVKAIERNALLKEPPTPPTPPTPILD